MRIILYMSTNQKYLSLTATFLVMCIALIVFTVPNIESSGIIFGFFLVLFLLIYYCSMLIMHFVGLTKNIKFRSIIIASSLLILQVLATFRALRIVEFLLVAMTFIVSSWYFSKRNHK